MSENKNSHRKHSAASSTSVEDFILLEDEDKARLQLADKRKRRRKAQKTAEILEIDPVFLSLPSNELMAYFNRYIATLFEKKTASNSAISSLECYHIVLNSLLALYKKQYNDTIDDCRQTDEHELQKMANILLRKWFEERVEQQMGTSSFNKNIFLKFGKNGEEQLNVLEPQRENNSEQRQKCQQQRARLHCELLCLLEMHLLRSFPMLHMNWGMIKQKQNSKSITVQFAKERKVEMDLTPTQMVTKNIVNNLRTLYILCDDPEHFRLFVEDVLCDEFIDDLPFYLACIFEQLELQMPADLQPFRSIQNEISDDESANFVDFAPYRNQISDRLEQFLQQIDLENNEQEQKENINIGRMIERSKQLDQSKNKKKRGIVILNGKKQKKLEEAIEKQAVSSMAPKKSTRSGTLNKNRSPLKIGDMQTLSRRRILHLIVPQTPLKKIQCQQIQKKHRNSQKSLLTMVNENGDRKIDDKEQEIIEQTPIGKIRNDDSALSNRLSELLLREEQRMNRIQQNLKLIEPKPNNSSTTITCQKNSATMARPSKNSVSEKPQKFWHTYTDVHSVIDDKNNNNGNNRKRPLTPTDLADFLHFQQLQQQQARKRPKRQLFCSSRSSTTTTSVVSFPFGVTTAPESLANRKS